MTCSLNLRLRSLHNFFVIYLARARDLAKEDKKDEARDWLRFFDNACLLELLTEQGALVHGEAAMLERWLRELRSECHPEDIPDYRTDLQAIRGALARIEKAVASEQELEISSPHIALR